MKTTKIALVAAFLIVLLTTFAVTILGAIGTVPLKDGALIGCFVVLGLELVGAIVAAFNTKDFFKDDPQSIAYAKRHYEDLITQMKTEQLNEVAGLQAHHAKIIKELEAKNRDLSSEVHNLRNRLNPKSISPIASGSARTSEKK
jgi:hypothetical protein